MTIVRGLLPAIGFFLPLGIFLRWVRAPGIIAWPAILLGVIALVFLVYGMIRPPEAPADLVDLDDGAVVLRDGRRYRVEVTDERFTLTNLETGTAEEMPWSEVTAVFLIAIDAFPAGSLSYIMHRCDGESLEVPTDSAGNETFLHELQTRFEGFDNAAFVQAMGSLHGFWELWRPRESPAP